MCNLTLQRKKLRKAAGSGIIEEKSKPPATEPTAAQEISTKAGGNVNFICKLDRSIYSCVTEDIVTDEVIITDERISHSNKHKNAYDKYLNYIPEALNNPDYIFEDKRPNTGIVAKRITDEKGKALQIILRIKTEADDPAYKNSIISCWDISESRLQTYIKNRKILYKKP